MLKAKECLRRLIAQAQSLRLSLCSTPWPTRPASGATLIIAPHQDDEILGCGLLLAERCAKKESVHLVYLTDGSGSHPNHPAYTPPQIAALRHREVLAMADFIGLDHQRLHFLKAADGKLPHLSIVESARLESDLSAILQLDSFDQVFTPLSCDGSSEHEAAYTLVRRCLPPSIRLFQYPVWARWASWRLFQIHGPAWKIHQIKAPALHPVKQKALSFYQSQIQPLAPWKEAVLSSHFLAMFNQAHEFYFEHHPLPSTRLGMKTFLKKNLDRLIHRFILSPAGAGKPVAEEFLDAEYRSGAWDHFWGEDEEARHQILRELIEQRGSTLSLLDLGCGSGRLASLLNPHQVPDYLGVDLSEEGLRKARQQNPDRTFLHANYEQWTPTQLYDVITFNECLGYARIPADTIATFSRFLKPGGCIIVSHFRWGNHAAIWKALANITTLADTREARNNKGQVWDLKILLPK
jgi:LmbE family N-acetylglucosaminyl deacetylase